LHLDKVLNFNDIRFIKHAIPYTTQEDLDRALEDTVKLRPKEYTIQKILLDGGAQLHKRWTEDDGWGYLRCRDEIDEVGTQLLKKQIEIFLKGEK
jgi:hypothetical protein